MYLRPNFRLLTQKLKFSFSCSDILVLTELLDKEVNRTLQSLLDVKIIEKTQVSKFPVAQY